MKKYINYFFSLRSAPELLPFFRAGRSVSAKEVTESYSVFTAILEELKVDKDDPTVTVICPGDGQIPRTSGLISHLTQWNCVSIDPELNIPRWQGMIDERLKSEYPLQRIEARKEKAGESKVDCKGGRCILALVHSHAPILECLTIPVNYSRVDCVSLVCCEPPPEKILTRESSKKHSLRFYIDENVWSPKRSIYIWENLR